MFAFILHGLKQKSYSIHKYSFRMFLFNLRKEASDIFNVEYLKHSGITFIFNKDFHPSPIKILVYMHLYVSVFCLCFTNASCSGDAKGLKRSLNGCINAGLFICLLCAESFK